MARSITSELLQLPIPACHVVPATPNIQIPKTCRVISATHLRITKHPPGFRLRSTIKATTQSSGLILAYYNSGGETKKALYVAIQGINRGIFGVPSAKKAEIEGLVQLLESQNPIPDPTEDLKKVDGCWKLLYSTITILGIKRTKLGLRDLVALGDFLQIIDVAKGKTVNVIEFNVRGLKMLTGQLTVEASFSIASKSRVDIKYENSTVAPDQLMNLFRRNYEILLAIFNPEGWLEISYVDESLRIGRDDKGNIFILERFEQKKVQDLAQ